MPGSAAGGGGGVYGSAGGAGAGGALHYSVGPSAFLCVLTQEPCRDPVVARNGHTYSRFAITRWMEVSTGNQHSWRCPLSNNLLTDFTLVPNYMIKGFCDDYWLLADAAAAKAAAAAVAASAAVAVILDYLLVMGKALAWRPNPSLTKWCAMALEAGVPLGSHVYFSANVRVANVRVQDPQMGHCEGCAAIFAGIKVLIVASCASAMVGDEMVGTVDVVYWDTGDTCRRWSAMLDEKAQ